MTKMQEIIGKILTSRITREKTAGALNVEEVTNTLNIFLAGSTITSEQYSGFIEMVTPVATTNITTGATGTNNITGTTQQ